MFHGKELKTKKHPALSLHALLVLAPLDSKSAKRWLHVLSAFLFSCSEPTPCRLPPLLNFTNCAPLTGTSDVCVTEASGRLFGVHLT